MQRLSLVSNLLLIGFHRKVAVKICQRLGQPDWGPRVLQSTYVSHILDQPKSLSTSKLETMQLGTGNHRYSEKGYPSSFNVTAPFLDPMACTVLYRLKPPQRSATPLPDIFQQSFPSRAHNGDNTRPVLLSLWTDATLRHSHPTITYSGPG